VYFQNADKLVISKTLKFFEDLLEGSGFFRINRKDLVNLKYIQSYSRQKKARVVLPGNLWLELSDARKEAFLHLFQIRG
jgi:two-component system LytT family response regulator